MVRSRSSLLLVLVWSSLAAAAMPAERPISAPRLGIAAKSEYFGVRGVAGGGRFLLTWYSNDRGGQALLLDDAGRRIYETSLGLPLSPEVAFWRDGAWTILGWTATGLGWVRMDRDGVLLDRDPHPLERGQLGVFEDAVWTGEALIAAYQDHDPYDTGRGPKFTIAVYDSELRLKTTHALGRWGVALQLVTDDTSALVLFRENPPLDNRPTYGVLFGRDGSLLEAKKDLGEIGSARATSSGGGTGYVVLTTDYGYSGTSRATFGGFLLNHQLVRKSAIGFGNGGSLYATSGAPVWDGSSFVFFYVGWVNQDAGVETRMVRLSAQGRLLEDGLAMKPDLYMRLSSTGVRAVAGMGTTLLVYGKTAEASDWETRDFYLHLRAGHAPADFQTADELPMERGATQQVRPAATSSRTQSLVAWRERIEAHQPLWLLATRVDGNGNVLDPLSITLATSTCERATPGLASDGDGFLAAWYDAEGVMIAHVRPDGSVGARTRIEKDKKMPCRENAPVVVSNGSEYLVVWLRTAPFRDTVLAARVRADGTLIDSVPLDLGESEKYTVVAAASDGRDYLLAWDGRMVRVSANGTRLDPQIGLNRGKVVDGNHTTLLWWNGTAYSLVQMESTSQVLRYELVHVDSNGSVMKLGPAPKNPNLGPMWGYSSPLCRDSACVRLWGTVEDSGFSLRKVMTIDEGNRATQMVSNPIPVAPVYQRQEGEWMSIVPFGVPGGRLFAAMTRYVLDPPLAGISRVFIRPVDGARTRAVRH